MVDRVAPFGEAAPTPGALVRGHQQGYHRTNAMSSVPMSLKRSKCRESAPTRGSLAAIVHDLVVTDEGQLQVVPLLWHCHVLHSLISLLLQAILGISS